MDNPRVKEIREEVKGLITRAVSLLEENYDMENAKIDNPAYMTMLDLNGALAELGWLDEENLKIKE